MNDNNQQDPRLVSIRWRISWTQVSSTDRPRRWLFHSEPSEVVYSAATPFYANWVTRIYCHRRLSIPTSIADDPAAICSVSLPVISASTNKPCWSPCTRFSCANTTVSPLNWPILILTGAMRDSTRYSNQSQSILHQLEFKHFFFCNLGSASYYRRLCPTHHLQRILAHGVG